MKNFSFVEEFFVYIDCFLNKILKKIVIKFFYRYLRQFLHHYMFSKKYLKTLVRNKEFFCTLSALIMSLANKKDGKTKNNDLKQLAKTFFELGNEYYLIPKHKKRKI